MHVVIIGGSTAGASFAAQLRRHSESCHITLLEKSAYLATAYCGLAYAAGGMVRSDPDYLRPLDPNDLRERFNVDVRLRHEVVRIDARHKTVCVRDAQHTLLQIPYDELVYATGARSRVPDVPGTALAGVHTLRTTEDLETLLATLARPEVRHALIVGAGFIGIELAESLKHRGLEVTLLERAPQVMAGKIDADMARLVATTLHAQGVALRLNEALCEIAPRTGEPGLAARTARGTIPADVVILTAGIQPNSELAAAAGLELGAGGTVRVDARLRTSDPHIHALGDVAEIFCRVSGLPTHVPLAGPLGRQAKVLASCLTGGSARYPGSLGTCVCKVFDQTVASTGMTETRLTQSGIAYRSLLIPATNHVYFYPGTARMTLKLIYAEDGRILGAQVVGGEGSDKRIDVLATAITAGMSVSDLEYLELAYAPPYGAPKDIINQAGALATSQLGGAETLLHPDKLSLPEFAQAVLVDIRSAEEYETASLPGAVHIPAEQLRQRSATLPRDRPIVLFCNSGAKGTSAQQVLAAAGFRSFNLMGGLALMNSLNAPQPPAAAAPPADARPRAARAQPLPPCDTELDLRGLICPGPLVAAGKHLAAAPRGQVVRILTTDTAFRQDFQNLIRRLGLSVIGEGHRDGAQWITVRVAAAKRTETADVGQTRRGVEGESQASRA